MFTWSLCVHLDLTTTPPSVKDVKVIKFNGGNVYSLLNAPHSGPYAILADLTARSNHEASIAMRGLIVGDKDLAWVMPYPGIQEFLDGFRMFP